MAKHILTTGLIVGVLCTCLLMAIGHPLVVYAQAPLTEVSNLQGADARPASTQISFSGAEIVGLSDIVQLDRQAREIDQLWSKLTSNQVLMANVNWQKGKIIAYAYYHSFNDDLTAAHLFIGFRRADLLLATQLPTIQLPSGLATQFVLDSQSGVPQDSAWIRAYAEKNLIERHTLDSQGLITGGDAIVISQ